MGNELGKTVVKELPDRNYFKRQQLPAYLSPRHPSNYELTLPCWGGSPSWRHYFSREVIEFPRMLMMTLDSLILRASLYDGVHAIEVKGNFPLALKEAKLEKEQIQEDMKQDKIWIKRLDKVLKRCSKFMKKKEKSRAKKNKGGGGGEDEGVGVGEAELERKQAEEGKKNCEMSLKGLHKQLKKINKLVEEKEKEEEEEKKKKKKKKEKKKDLEGKKVKKNKGEGGRGAGGGRGGGGDDDDERGVEEEEGRGGEDEEEEDDDDERGGGGEDEEETELEKHEAKKDKNKKKKDLEKKKAKKNKGGGEGEDEEETELEKHEEKKDTKKEKPKSKEKKEVPREDPDLWISVLHMGEKISFDPPGQELIKLWDQLNEFPPSMYVLEINNATTQRKYTQKLSRPHGEALSLFDVEHTNEASSDPMDWTRVTFYPRADVYHLFPRDNLVLKRFFWKRVMDTATTLRDHVKVVLDDIQLEALAFVPYMGLYPKELSALEMTDETFPFNEEKPLDRYPIDVTCSNSLEWELAFSLSDGEFQHVSFVNGIPTARGGTHVELIKDWFTEFGEQSCESNGKFNIDNYRLFISLIMKEEPTFDSKARDRLVTPLGKFGLLYYPDQLRVGIALLSGRIPYLENSQQIPDVTALVDAHEAGGEEASNCYLFLTEGESAKDFALSGISSLGNKYYGVLPLRGKIPNVKMGANVYSSPDLINIMRSLGLEIGVCYKSLPLRYGHLVLMMDQDTDGSHIKGLIINFLHQFWPSLLQKKDFLFHFITPIIKVTTDEKELKFFSIPQYDKWTKTDANHANWKTKFYKGLGSHTAEEAKEYFKEITSHMKGFRYSGEQDFNVIDLVFSPSRVNDRKYWITRYQEDTFTDSEIESVTYAEFLNKTMILYSIDDIKRSIPSMVDGLKPSQRKILFSAFKRNLVEALRVAQFSGYVCEQCEYHHSQNSMSETIIRMAQEFVGANNINLFLPIGQFGTRRQGGKSHADARYINTYLSLLANLIFRKDDRQLLNYLIEDGQQVQPSCYLPIIPMVLVNGCKGIATGWSTELTQYHPLEIIENIKFELNGEHTKSLLPWFRGFQGKVERADKFQLENYSFSGAIKEVESLKVEITELPVWTNTENYKSFLGEQVLKQKISSFQEDHRGDDLKFIVTFTEEQLAHIKKKKGGLEAYFKMGSTRTTDNIYLIDWKGSVKKYLSADEILSEFVKFRLPFYEKRKELLVGQYEEEVKRHRNIEKFVREFQDGGIKITLSTEGFIKQLLERGYESLKDDKDFSHIRELNLNDLMSKREDQKLALTEKKLAHLKQQTPKELWIAELDELADEFEKLYGKEGKGLAHLKQQTPKELWIDELDELADEIEKLFGKEGKGQKRKGYDLVHSGEKRARKEKSRKKEKRARKEIKTVDQKEGTGENQKGDELVHSGEERARKEKSRKKEKRARKEIKKVDQKEGTGENQKGDELVYSGEERARKEKSRKKEKSARKEIKKLDHKEGKGEKRKGDELVHSGEEQTRKEKSRKKKKRTRKENEEVKK